MWVYWYTVLALQTCASTNELRAIRLRDISLSSQTLRIGVEGSKNKYRNRTIPLATSEAIAAIVYLEARARSYGSHAPEHYLFPFRARGTNGNADPRRPMSDSGLKRTWDDIRTEAKMPRLRPYDLRHTAITRMAEAGTPIAIIMSFAGHVSVKMQQHYTTISMQAKRAAAAAAWTIPPPAAPAESSRFVN
jgi:integrase